MFVYISIIYHRPIGCCSPSCANTVLEACWLMACEALEVCGLLLQVLYVLEAFINELSMQRVSRQSPRMLDRSCVSWALAAPWGGEELSYVALSLRSLFRLFGQGCLLRCVFVCVVLRADVVLDGRVEPPHIVEATIFFGGELLGLCSLQWGSHRLEN